MTIRLGLLGESISYSRSPEIFASIEKLTGHDIEFTLFDCADSELPSILARMKAENYTGCSVTIPHKQAVIPLLDLLCGAAKTLQAVNSIQHTQGRLSGYNTDVDGLAAQFEVAGIPDKAHALVLGAGGAARATVLALLRRGALITVTCRDERNFRALASLFPEESSRLSFLPWLDQNKAESSHLIINATPLGGANAAEAPCPIDFRQHRGTYVDLNYNRDNRWLRKSREAGWITLDGSVMLVAQAVKSFALWTGISVSVTRIHTEVFGGNAA